MTEEFVPRIIEPSFEVEVDEEQKQKLLEKYG